MKTALKRLGLLAGVVLVLGLVAGWSTRRSWAAGMLVLAPFPNGMPCAAPADVERVIMVTRGGATVRAWVFAPREPVRGTLLLLHGIRSDKRALLADARQHAARGFRVVAVDSRGHGESAGRYLTYGVEESRDLKALTDELERQQLLAQPLAVIGSSYGAATALQYAAIDARVAKVAALASFASLREVVPAYLIWFFGWPGRLAPAILVDDLVDGATRQAGFDADRACPRCVAPRIQASVLLIHSRDDERIPWRHSVAIRDALTRPAKLMLTSGVGHVATGGGRGVAEAVERWIN